MSWPQVFVRYNGQLRKATLWGCNRRAYSVVDDKLVNMPQFAIEIYCPDGQTVYPEPRRKSFIVPISDVVTVNWEASEFLKRHGIEFPDAICTGYGADVKQASLEAERGASSLFPCPMCGKPYSINDPKNWHISPAVCKECRPKRPKFTP